MSWSKPAALFGFALALLAASFFAAAQGPQAAADAPKPEQPRQFALAIKPWTGDFDKMLQRRVIRIDVPYSRSLYFIDKGRERGLNAELARDFERWLNQKHAKTLGKRPLTVYIVAATRDKLLTDLEAGLADIAIGNLTVTEERLRLVDFVAPEGSGANIEILATGPASPVIATVDDLAGKTVHVRRSSSYYESLVALNERLRKAGKPEVQLVLVPDALEDRTLFAFASYNAGPGNISRMRKEAAKRGLDPDKWFNNVEVVTAEKIGIETTTYVRNIFKYYASYKLTLDAKLTSDKLKRDLAPGRN